MKNKNLFLLQKMATVLMSIETYERNQFKQDIYEKLDEAEDDLKNKRYTDLDTAMAELDSKY